MILINLNDDKNVYSPLNPDKFAKGDVDESKTEILSKNKTSIYKKTDTIECFVIPRDMNGNNIYPDKYITSEAVCYHDSGDNCVEEVPYFSAPVMELVLYDKELAFRVTTKLIDPNNVEYKRISKNYKIVVSFTGGDNFVAKEYKFKMKN